MSTETEYSEAQETAEAVQRAFSMCATCTDLEDEHDEDGCQRIHEIHDTSTGELKQSWKCTCPEFWPWQPQYEDGWNVSSHEIALGGSVGLILNARVPQELWDQLQTGNVVRLTVDCRVEGKGFKPVKEKGVMVGLAETRKLAAESLVLDRGRKTEG